MQGRNTVDEVLRLSAERGYTVFYRNGEDSNVLNDIVVAHLTSIAMIRTWLYVLIMDTTYKTNKYNMPLLECVGMTLTRKNFTVVTAFMCNEQATTYRWVLQQMKHLYFTSAMSNGQGSTINEGEPLVKIMDELKKALSLEYVFIAHRKIGKSSDSGSGSGSGSGSCSNPIPRRSNGRSSLSTVVSPDSPPVPFPFKNAFPGVLSNFLFGDENHWVEIRRRMSYDLRHRMHTDILLITVGRWMPFAPITCAMGISSRYAS
ncbi:hypothetical protein M9H77_31695 [Catharanthus roseus]|uniref:Uncharacterized protein n=1 Tax=Catharanthus roseus TaxID=4058 RepID=A0ACC0A0W1_CATRO|nr:hypothetical protein M9H77_31695 [Catharanthus roseus]